MKYIIKNSEFDPTLALKSKIFYEEKSYGYAAEQ